MTVYRRLTTEEEFVAAVEELNAALMRQFPDPVDIDGRGCGSSIRLIPLIAHQLVSFLDLRERANVFT